MDTILNVENAEKYYGKEPNLDKALDRVAFKVNAGEFVSIMGPSGSGKTTLLNCISTIDTVDAGHVYLDGQDLASLSQQKSARFRQENLGFIFQDFNLLDTLSIEENIALPLAVRDVPAKEIKDTVRSLMRRLGIGDIAAKFPAQVSGGQKQRCACARAFVNKPRLVLADEPTGALDSVSAGQLLALLTELNEQENATILMVTHDPLSASYGSRVLFLKDGRINKELHRGRQGRSDFYHAILSEVSAFGGM
ncbi:MAG: ABC transporter ATP-binding protein [Lachnospiraceae bacterium]|nr:ABC transporter ATP-binding protein [Lachnospiraceae bacterium]MDE7330629.1 ABC transporter ATP-binding protein [Lachnospiraceae bacterium]